VKTRITELLGLEHPIVQGRVRFVVLAELTSTVSNARGLGILAHNETPQWRSIIGGYR